MRSAFNMYGCRTYTAFSPPLHAIQTIQNLAMLDSYLWGAMLSYTAVKGWCEFYVFAKSATLRKKFLHRLHQTVVCNLH